jgi:response regulator NasT
MAALLPKGSGSQDDLEDCQDEVRDLRAALVTRPVIDQAKGLLIAHHGCSPEEAFEMLAQASQRCNRKVRDIAQAMVDGAHSG